MCFYNAHCGFTYDCKIPSGSGVSSMPRKCMKLINLIKLDLSLSWSHWGLYIARKLALFLYHHNYKCTQNNTFPSDKMVAWSLGRGLFKFQILVIFFCSFLHLFFVFVHIQLSIILMVSSNCCHSAAVFWKQVQYLDISLSLSICV
jgi:hypothetical protein